MRGGGGGGKGAAIPFPSPNFDKIPVPVASFLEIPVPATTIPTGYDRENITLNGVNGGISLSGHNMPDSSVQNSIIC